MSHPAEDPDTSDVVGGNIPTDHLPDKRGEWQLLGYRDPDGTPHAKRILFGCPGANGKRPEYPAEWCTVPLVPMVRADNGEIAPGPVWDFDGNFGAPTISPSINCMGCWHGFIRNGEVTDA